MRHLEYNAVNSSGIKLLLFEIPDLVQIQNIKLTSSMLKVPMEVIGSL